MGKPPRLLAFFCTVMFLVPSYSVLPGPFKSNGSVTRILALTFLVISVLGFVLGRRGGKKGRIAWPGALILLAYFSVLLIIWGVGLTTLGTDAVELAKARALIPTMGYIGIALYAMTRVERRDYSLLLKCLAVGICVNCIIGILQVWLHWDLKLLFQIPGFVVNASTDGSDVVPSLIDRYGQQRAFGTSQHAIEYSVLAAVAVPLMLFFAKHNDGDRTRRSIALFGAFIALAAMVSGISRSGVVALLAALFVYVWTISLRQLIVGLLAGAVGLAIELIAFPDTVTALWLTISNSSTTSTEGEGSVVTRVQDYARVAETFAKHRLFGVGYGAAPVSEYGYLDNQWLQAVLQGGILGVTSMLILTLGGLFGFGLALRRVSNRIERDQVFVMGAMYTGILASSFTFDLFAFPQASLLFFLMFGMLWSGVRIYSVDRSGPPTTARTGRGRQD